MTTQDLLATVRWSAPPAPVDWTAVERAVGRRYPAEFTEIADALPPGSFQTFLSLLHPGNFKRARAYAKEVRGYADQLRGDAAERAFPYPIYPDVGGVLPFATIGFDWIIGWLPDGDDPDKWPVILCDSRLSSWYVYHLSTAEFLTAVVTLPAVIEPIAYVAEETQPPSFAGIYRESPPAPSAPDPNFWAGPAEGRPLTGPADAVDELRALVRPAPVPPVDWGWVQGRLGFHPPADYRRLVDELGGITVGPVTVAAPGGPSDFVGGLDKLRKRVVRLRSSGDGPRGTIWPEPRGALKWADLAGGGVACWLFTSVNPAEWPVLTLDADLRGAVTHSMSASRFLLEIATNPAGVVLTPPA